MSAFNVLRTEHQLVGKREDGGVIGIDLRKSGIETILIKFRQCGE